MVSFRWSARTESCGSTETISTSKWLSGSADLTPLVDEATVNERNLRDGSEKTATSDQGRRLSLSAWRDVVVQRPDRRMPLLQDQNKIGSARFQTQLDCAVQDWR